MAEIDITSFDNELEKTNMDLKEMFNLFDNLTRRVTRFNNSLEGTTVGIKDTSRYEKFLKGIYEILDKMSSSGAKAAEAINSSLGGINPDTSQFKTKLVEAIELMLKFQTTIKETKNIPIEGTKKTLVGDIDIDKLKNLLTQLRDSYNSLTKSQENTARASKKVADSEKEEMSEHEKLEKVLSSMTKKNFSPLQQYLSGPITTGKLDNVVQLLEKARSQVELGSKEWRQYTAMIDECNRRLQQQNGLMGKIQSAMGPLKNTASQVAMSFGVMTGVFGTVQFVRRLYQITSEFQLQQRALSAIVDNAREANILFKQMQTLSVESPMKLMDLNKYAKQLSAFKIETQDLYSTLKMLGDISVGVGINMDRLILAYGQVKAANYLRGQELRQFSEAGVNILGSLQEYYRVTKGINMSINDIFESVSKRKVLFEDVEAALKRLTDAGGTFYNMQLIQSQTLYGQSQKLSDMFQIEMNNIGKAHSGTMMALVKTAQLFIQNLKLITNALLAVGASRGLMNLGRRFLESREAASLLWKEVKNTRREVNLLSAEGMRKFIANIKAAKISFSSLQAVISAATLALSLGFTLVMNKIQKARQAAEDLSNEILELNRRKREIGELGDAFEQEYTFKGQLALLQQLVTKAKEYNLQLKLPNHVNERNIAEVFRDATRQIENYVEQVQYYNAVILSGKGVEKTVKKLDGLNVGFALAQGSAENLYNYLLQNEDKLDKNAQSEFNTLRNMYEEYQKDEDAAIKKYGMTTSQWKLEFMNRVKTLSDSMHMFFVEGQTWSDFMPGNEVFDYQMGQIDNFLDKYEKKIKKATRKIKNALKRSSIDMSGWGRLDDKSLRSVVEKQLPSIIETFKQFGDFSKEQIEEIISRISGVPREKIVKIMYELENTNSDVEKSVAVRMLEKLLGDEPIEKDVKLNVDANPELFSDKTIKDIKDWSRLKKPFKEVVEEGMKQYAEEGIDKTLEDIEEKANKTAYNIYHSSDNWDTKIKNLRNRYKELQNEMDRYKRKGSDLALLNEVLGHSFDNVADAEKAMQYEQKYITDALTRLGVGVDEKNKSRSQSFKSEFQSMIDFIKKLNSEYEKLRKTFDQVDSKEWAGAFHRTIDSYREAFDAMPAEFKNKFQNLITNIQFMTKEATADSLRELEGLIQNTGKLTAKEKAELLRNLHMAIGGLEEEVDIKLKKDADLRLHEQIDKIFADYQLTLELKKLDIDVDSVATTFNIDTTSLSEVYRKLQDLKEKFQGEDEVKKYREYVRKLTEINDKANLEMSKNYAKYLQKELDERAKVELEYMKKRAEVMALPFGENEAAILDGLQKEMKKKLDELDWKQFQSSDFYIQMFEDLGSVSDQALTTMLDKLNELKSTLTNLSPTELKTLTDQMLKIQEVLITRNPFRELSNSMKEIKAMKGDTTLQSILDEFVGDDKIKGFKNRAEAALTEINKQMMEQVKKRSELQEKMIAKGTIEAGYREGFQTTLETDFDTMLKELEDKRAELVSSINKMKAQASLTDEEQSVLTNMEGQKAAMDEQISMVTKLQQSWALLGEEGYKSVGDFENALEQTNNEIENLAGKRSKVQALTKELTKQQKSAIEYAHAMVDMVGKMKNLFDSTWDMAEALGAETDVLTDAWKEFGDTLFDTITQALEMIPALITGFTSAGIAINSAMGIIGLIAEAIQLVITLVTALAKLHDAKLQKTIDNLQKSVDNLKKSAEDLKEVFDNLFNTDKIRAYNAAIIKSKEITIKNLEEMIKAEEAKKKTDQQQIDTWNNEIEDINKEIQEQIEDFYETLGGFGSLSNMKSMAEEWTNAWYEAFKETGDGLSGLEDSFDEFLDNLYKKQILNNIAEKYFAGMYEELDRILAKQGGLTENRDEFTDWLNRIQQVFYDFNEEAGEYAQALQAMGGTGADLEGLTASIQGMTEDTADALVAYLNSIRLYVADNGNEIEQLRLSLCSDNNENPIISQLKIIALQTTGINTLLNSVLWASGNNNQPGPAIKVVL